MYVMKNIVDPNYEKALKQNALLPNQNQVKTVVNPKLNPQTQNIVQKKL